MERPNTNKLLHFAKEMRKAPSDAEQLLWKHLRNRHKFRRQQPIGPFIADFACEAIKLIVEVDGDQHGDEAAAAYDADRTKALNSMGWRVIRFTARDVVKEIDAVRRSIVFAARPHPNPLP